MLCQTREVMTNQNPVEPTAKGQCIEPDALLPKDALPAAPTACQDERVEAVDALQLPRHIALPKRQLN